MARGAPRQMTSGHSILQPSGPGKPRDEALFREAIRSSGESACICIHYTPAKDNQRNPAPAKDMSDRQPQQPALAGSQTTTQTTDAGTHREPPRTLRLRGGHSTNGRSVQWAEDVVDNEGLGRKSSKVCCIYHKPKAVDESSDESSSGSSSDSDSEREAKNKSSNREDKTPACGHSHYGHGRGRRKKQGERQERLPSPNAYEKVPKPKPTDESGAGKSKT